jgi:hypothetical protein
MTAPRAVIRGMLAMYCASILAGCNDEDRRTDADLTTEAEVMGDIVRAAAVIEERLRERVQPNGSIIVVREKLGGFFLSLQAMPARTPWAVNCGPLGLELSFGSTGPNGNGVIVGLSYARLDEQTCRSLVPLTASKLASILKGT